MAQQPDYSNVSVYICSADFFFLSLFMVSLKIMFIMFKKVI